MKKKIRELKQKIIPKQTRQVMSDLNVKKQVEKLHRKYVNVTVDKASSKFVFICTKYYISKILAEVSPNKNKNSSSTYSGIQNSRGEIIKAYIKHCKNFDLKITKQGKLFR